MKPFQQEIGPQDVGELIDFSVHNNPNTRSMAELQREGVAALYNILCKQDFAYLADEVGMGKTYQALALAAVVWNEKPDARLLFISPRENLQVKWGEDYKRFFASNYRRAQRFGDDRVVSLLFSEPVHAPTLLHNLRSWALMIGTPKRFAPFLRHTSFTRPVFLTTRDLGDMRALRAEVADRFRNCGLLTDALPPRIKPDEASRELNLAFARALNAKLASHRPGCPYFDLVIVDEAQCLRHPDNQTNQVLHETLREQVGKWLFMSATPAHGGPQDLPTILNHYPGRGEVLDPDLATDLPALQQELQAFMVRRSREYNTKGGAQPRVGKADYRNHDRDGWAVRDSQMSALGTLAVGLVQKGLVGVLQGRSNRYRIGFLSSFESLQSSLHRVVPIAPAEQEADGDPAKGGDWYDGAAEPTAPDTEFITRLADDFEQRFQMPLPHPKIDAVVDQVGPRAFGNENLTGGEKFLIFTRRVSTVATLRERMTRQYLRSIEQRIRRCWGVDLDWSGKAYSEEDEVDTDDPEAFDSDQERNPLREAMARNGWLYRYRQTFRDSGRNALFFEDGWLLRPCQAGGVTPEHAAAALPKSLWAESWTHASKASGARRSQHRADRLRYLAVHALRGCPQVFGLTNDEAAPWVQAYEAALHNHLEQAAAADKPHVDKELFTEPTLWTCWDKRFSDDPLALPAADPRTITAQGGCEALCQRQVARTLLSQTFRLTDTLLDLFFADRNAKRRTGRFANAFLDWLQTDDPAARRLRNECGDWLAHLRLIVDSCLDGAGRSWLDLAGVETWHQLFAPTAVLGVTGGSGGHQTAIRQFRTPSLPRVIVCTDTLKEGVDLHLFCDQVLHYGVAWTAGDLEQRVGRVDRYFSRIERRLASEGAPPDVQLGIGYPHLIASLEREQVERVIARQQEAERLMDSPLAGADKGTTEFVPGASEASKATLRLPPFKPLALRQRTRNLVLLDGEAARDMAGHYQAWYTGLVNALKASDWRVSPNSDAPTKTATLCRQNAQHEISWSFDAGLERYILTIFSPPWPADLSFSGGACRRVADRGSLEETFVRVLVPTPDEGHDRLVIERIIAALDGQAPRPLESAEAHWGAAAAAVGRACWLSDHKAQVIVQREARSHPVTLYAYRDSIRIVGVISSIQGLGHLGAWGDAPTASSVRQWALGETNELGLGYLDVHQRDGLVFGIHALHGDLSQDARRQLIQETAWRADLWEASLTGGDNI